MDGHYLEKGRFSMNQKIQEWLEKELQHLSVRHPASIHLDALLDKNVGKDAIIDVSMETFLTLVEQVGETRLFVIPMLIIPLQVIGTQLTKEVPKDKAALIRELDDEPPSLYLLHPDTLKMVEFCEEYKCPLPFELAISSVYNLYIYYREFRCAEILTNQWEFSRCIYVRANSILD